MIHNNAYVRWFADLRADGVALAESLHQGRTRSWDGEISQDGHNMSGPVWQDVPDSHPVYVHDGIAAVGSGR